jgi:hypothetical protein
VLVAPTVENASVVVVSAVADTWAVPGPGALVGRLTARRGLVSAVRVERVGAVVGSGGPVVDVATDLAAGWAGTVSSPRTGVRRARGGWGLSRMAEATRAARTPVVSPRASSPSLQGHRDVVRCRGRDRGRCRGRDVGRDRGRDAGRCRGRDRVRCRGGGVGMVHGPGSTSFSGPTGPTARSDAWSYPVTRLAAFALSGAFDKSDAIRAPLEPDSGHSRVLRPRWRRRCQQPQHWISRHDGKGEARRRSPSIIAGRAFIVADRSPPPSCSTIAPGRAAASTRWVSWLAVTPGCQSAGSTLHSTVRSPSSVRQTS